MSYVGIDNDIRLEVGRRDAQGRPVDYIAGAPYSRPADAEGSDDNPPVGMGGE